MSIELIEEISEAARKNALTGKGLLVWVSGGVDSVCLLRLLAQASERGVVGPLEVAHVDHGLRSDSGSDAEFVAGLAAELGLAFHLVRLTPADFPSSMTIQEGARKARREKLDELRVARALSGSALAHHADDQAETVLFRLLRGAGPRGASGMAVWSPPYFRPLLGVRKTRLLELAQNSGWEYREDHTNATPKYSRNRVRNELLPLAREIVPGAEEGLCRFARLAGEDDRYLTEAAHREFKRTAVREPEGFSFPGAEFSALDPVIRRRLLLAAVEKLGFGTSRLDLSHLETVDDLLRDGGGSRTAPVPSPPVFASSSGNLWVYDPSRIVRPQAEEAAEVSFPDVSEEGVLLLPLPVGRPVGKATLRPRRPGDRLGSRKVKDLLMEAGIPRWRREATLIAEDSSGVLGVFAPARVFALPGPHGKALRLRRDWWLAAS